MTLVSKAADSIIFRNSQAAILFTPAIFHYTDLKAIRIHLWLMGTCAKAICIGRGTSIWSIEAQVRCPISTHRTSENKFYYVGDWYKWLRPYITVKYTASPPPVVWNQSLGSRCSFFWKMCGEGTVHFHARQTGIAKRCSPRSALPCTVRDEVEKVSTVFWPRHASHPAQHSQDIAGCLEWGWKKESWH